MFKCIDYGYQGSKFNVEVIGPHKGALSYVAKGPQCGSVKVNPLPGYREEDVRIGTEERTLISNVLPESPQEGPPLPKGLGIKWPRGFKC